MEADFARLLQDDNRAHAALLRAHEINRRDPHIATRVAALHRQRSDLDAAESALKDALESNRGDKKLNFQYAMLMRQMNPDEHDQLSYYFRRAFNQGDDNYSAQFWYARHAYESGDGERQREARDVFRWLRAASIDHDSCVKIRDVAHRDGVRRTFTGAVLRLETSHGFINVDGTGDRVFFHRTSAAALRWTPAQRRLPKGSS